MASAKILLVDDEPLITSLVAKKLQGADLEVVVAHDGESGLEIALAGGITAVVTDLQMPYMSGIELATELARDERTAHLPVLMLTARGYMVDQGEIKSTNIRALLPKPFSANDVLDRVLRMVAEASGGPARGVA
jgi:DNA-binding response OmpR family regulator